MYIVKNAFKNLGRNKGRNILLGVIIFSLILSTTVALIIHSASNKVIAEYKEQFGSKVTLGVDFDKLSGNNPNADGNFIVPTLPEISSQQYLAFAQSDYLKSYQMNIEAGVTLPELKAIGEEDNYYTDSSSPTAKVIGYSNVENLPGFVSGIRKISEGCIFQKENECLVSSDFAKLNHLKVGDTFQVVDVDSQKPMKLKISGIYADASKPYGGLPEGAVLYDNSYSNRRNEILIESKTILEGFPLSSLTIDAEYELKSPDLANSFEEELRDKGLNAVYTVQVDADSYDKMITPLTGVSKISLIFMSVVLSIGAIILLFVTVMAVRERKYEIGVLRAMGMKKGKIAQMLVIEIIMITMFCLVLGIGIGNVVAPPIADTLATNQIESANSDLSQGMIIGGSIENEPEVSVSQMSVSMTSQTVLQISFIALCVAVLSSAAGVIFITRYEPMKILSERN